MVPERLAWIGNIVLAGVGVYLSYAPVANTLGKVLTVGLATLIVLAALLMFPWGVEKDGSRVRLARQLRIRGRHNRAQVAGDASNQYMADGDINVRPAQGAEL